MLLALLWAIQFINVLVGYRLNIFGIWPRKIWGLVGVPFHPFLHGSFEHLFFNSIPLLVLMDFLLLSGMQNFICVSLVVIVLGGIAIWLVGRPGIHLGASSLVMGYWGYLLVNAYQHPSTSTIVLAAVCVYYFGGLLLQLFPTQERVSWEGHICGFVAGLAAVFLCPLTN